MSDQSKVVKKSLPPTAPQIERALSWLDAVDIRGAALHLATPVKVIPSVALTRTESGTSWRGHLVKAGDGIIGVAAEAAELVRLAHADGDSYLDLDCNDRTQWCKPLLSGGRKILFGVGVLFNGPIFNAEPNVSDTDLKAVLKWWLDEREVEKKEQGPRAAIVSCPGGLVLAWEKDRTVTVENYMRG